MIKYTTGNLLESKAEALVNTVNCQGIMGKGIAYQFKLKYPDNTRAYESVCQRKELWPGKMHYSKENDKVIINFPTKDGWREISKMQYITDGLDALKKLILDLGIKSIAIPPLGSGNGGLIWNEVKEKIQNKLEDLPEDIEVIIYEPSQNYVANLTKEPSLSTSALVLMELKRNLSRFNKVRLQKAAYIMDVLIENPYFKFSKHKYGPHDNNIDIISKNIKEYQRYYNVKNTEEAYKILYNKLISNKVEQMLEQLMPAIIKSTELVNLIKTDSDLECISTVLYIIKENKKLNIHEIVVRFNEWSEDKVDRFSLHDIESAIMVLEQSGLVNRDILGDYFIGRL